MRKSIQERVQAAFPGDVGDPFVLNFLEELRTNRREAEREVRRLSGLVVLLTVTFWLLNRGAVAEVNVGFVHLESVSTAAFLIPPLIEYLFLQVFLLYLEFEHTRQVHDAVIGERYSSVAAQDLELMLGPATSSWQQGKKFSVFYGKPGKATTFVSVVIGVGMTMLPMLLSVAITIYLIADLFAVNGFTSLLAWLSALAALVLFVVQQMVAWATSDGSGVDPSAAAPLLDATPSDSTIGAEIRWDEASD